MPLVKDFIHNIGPPGPRFRRLHYNRALEIPPPASAVSLKNYSNFFALTNSPVKSLRLFDYLIRKLAGVPGRDLDNCIF